LSISKTESAFSAVGHESAAASLSGHWFKPFEPLKDLCVQRIPRESSITCRSLNRAIDVVSCLPLRCRQQLAVDVRPYPRGHPASLIHDALDELTVRAADVTATDRQSSATAVNMFESARVAPALSLVSAIGPRKCS